MREYREMDLELVSFWLNDQDPFDKFAVVWENDQYGLLSGGIVFKSEQLGYVVIEGKDMAKSYTYDPDWKYSIDVPSMEAKWEFATGYMSSGKIKEMAQIEAECQETEADFAYTTGLIANNLFIDLRDIIEVAAYNIPEHRQKVMGRKKHTTEEFDVVVSEGMAAIYAPYNSDFVGRMKMLGGVWNAKQERWQLSEGAVDAAREAMIACYGRCDYKPSETVTAVVEIKSEVTSDYKDSFRLFGRIIATACGNNGKATIGVGTALVDGKAPCGDGTKSDWYVSVPAGCVMEVYDLPKDYAAQEVERLNEDDSYNAYIKDGSSKIYRSALIRERERLAKRIAEIDVMLESGGNNA